MPAYRMTFWRALLYLALAFGLTSTVLRFTHGIGAASNLSDEYPWGLWIGFDVLCGVGLAAGGFVITAVVYLFDLKRFRPIARPAILTAFLGYLLVILALLVDLGRPWNIWHPIIMWNPHSVMFEVAWCVTLYTTVLMLEFSGMIFERLGWSRAARVQHAVSLPLVIAGVILSTLHQSSLGSVYLIVPGKLHAFWYTPLLPVLFFVSAVSVGLAMVIVESHLSARAFGRKLETPLLVGIGRALLWVLLVHGALRFGDLWYRGVLGSLLEPRYESALLAVELSLGVVLPAILLGVRRVARSAGALYGVGLLVVLGFVAHRLNVSVTGFEAMKGSRYMPSLPEVGVTAMVIALGFAAFALAVKHLPVYPAEGEPEPGDDAARPAGVGPPWSAAPGPSRAATAPTSAAAGPALAATGPAAVATMRGAAPAPGAPSSVVPARAP